MRQLKAFLRHKNSMWNCQEPVCTTLNAWKCMNAFCNCWDATIGDMRDYVSNRFSTSELINNVSDVDTVLANAETIIDWAWEELRPFYNAVKAGKTFEAYVTEQGLTVDESWTCDDELANNDAAFILYVSAMGAIDCKYLWLDSGDLINATVIAEYLDSINAN